MAGEADELLAQGSSAAATELYVKATELAPESTELAFWAGLGVAGEDLERGAELVRRVATADPAWTTLLERLPEQLAPTAKRVLAALRTG